MAGQLLLKAALRLGPAAARRPGGRLARGLRPAAPAPGALGRRREASSAAAGAAAGPLYSQGSIDGTKASRGKGGGYLGTGFAPPKKGKVVLVTGASGQIGMELVPYLRDRMGVDNVIASDVKMPKNYKFGGSFVYCDVRDKQSLSRIVLENQVDCIVHLASILSAIGEKNPMLALSVNNDGIQNCLEIAMENDLEIYAPSTIAVFGPTTPKIMTPDITVMEPTTMYGITKVHAELLGNYYADKYGLDFRSLRYPGIVSSEAMPGGGTTDYAVEIYYKALQEGRYESFLAGDTELPFMYMPDCLKATYELINAPREKLTRRVYNITAMTFSPDALEESIKKFIPEFEMTCHPDFRQEIALTWPTSIDDSNARDDWGWAPDHTIDSMTEEMLARLAKKMNPQSAIFNHRSTM